MAFLALNSEITIGRYKFSSVHECRIKRSIHNCADAASISLSAIVKIVRGKNAMPARLAMSDLINEGDKIVIKLGYNGVLNTEFEGFVRSKNREEDLLRVECEGYVRKLRLDMDESRHYDSTTAKQLLGLIKTKVPEVKVVVKDELPVYNITLTNANGEDIVKNIKELSQGTFAIFFINPTTLWCGLTYTPYSDGTDPFDLGTVNYRIGWNVERNNSLKVRVVEGEPVQIIFNGILPTGRKISTVSQDKAAKNKVRTLINNIQDEAVLKQMANEKQLQSNYAGYEGHISAFLFPYCAPGWKANIVDSLTPERNGAYLVESTEVTFGMGGAWRNVEIGPKIGFEP